MKTNVTHDSGLKRGVGGIISKVYGSWPARTLKIMVPRTVRRKVSGMIGAVLAAFEDWIYLRAHDVPYLPPRPLRFRVLGSTDIAGFLATGEIVARNLTDALGRLGRNISSFENVLDLGCGCSRVLRWYEKYSGPCKFYGTDIDRDAIYWDKENILFAKFTVNGELPPLPYPPETFDLIYGISIFTHIDEKYQFQWLSELARVAKSKAILIMTVHGRYARDLAGLSPAAAAQLEDKGFLFVKGDAWKGIFPDSYQNTFHTKAYVLKEWAKYFDVLEYIERGLNEHQDMIVLMKADRA